MEYTHGGDIEGYRRKYGKEPLDFSANINPQGLPDGIKAAIIGALDELSDYPDSFSRELVEAIGKEENIDKSYILAGNGAADSIFRICLGLKPKKALLLAPSFSEYEQGLSTVECEIGYYYLEDEKGFRLGEDIVEELNKGYDMVFICNPNNPTGVLAKKDILIKIADKCRKKGTVLVMDECFTEFLERPMEYSLKDKIEEYKNLIILRSFTKFYAMAGIRLGYLITANMGYMEKMYLSGQPWSVSTVAQVAGIAALKEERYAKRTLEEIGTERDYLKEKLREIGFMVYDSRANYIFFKSEIEDLGNKMKKEGILIRECENYLGLDKRYYRVAVKSRENNEVLIEKLNKYKEG